VETGNHHHRRFNSVTRQFPGRDGGLLADGTHGNQGDIAALPDHLRLSEFEAPVQARHRDGVVLPQAVIHRPRKIARLADGRGRLRRVRWNRQCESREGAQRADVFQGVVRPPGVAVLEAGSHAHNPDRQFVGHRAVANEFERTQRCEGRDGIGVRPEPGLGQACGHADHVLLGHARVQKTLREALAKRLQGHIAKVAGQQHDTRVVARQLAEGIDECLSQLDCSNSSMASRYSCSLMGR